MLSTDNSDKSDKSRLRGDKTCITFQLIRDKSPVIRESFLGRFSRCQSVDSDNDEIILKDYFQLDHHPRLSQLYEDWSKVDPHFSSVASRTPGIRVLRQDPVECLFSFICSTNNNIKRITSMVATLCRLYGERVCVLVNTIDGARTHEPTSGEPKVVLERGTKRRKLDDDHFEEKGISGISIDPEISIADRDSRLETFYDFPIVTRLAEENVDDTLKANGFGYRAGYVSTTAAMLMDKFGHHEQVERGLRDLRSPCSRDAAKEFLLTLKGVGPKVADCVCLMSLDKTDAVPVDTHVKQITGEKYMPLLRQSTSLTRKTYEKIGDFYRQRFGQHAGWAHSVLFSAEITDK